MENNQKNSIEKEGVEKKINEQNENSVKDNASNENKIQSIINIITNDNRYIFLSGLISVIIGLIVLYPLAANTFAKESSNYNSLENEDFSLNEPDRNNEKSNKEVLDTDFDTVYLDNAEFYAIRDVMKYKSPYEENMDSIGQVDEGLTVQAEIMYVNYNTGEKWLKLMDGEYVEMNDGESTYLEQIDWSLSNKFDSSNSYTALITLQGISKNGYLSNITYSPGDTIEFNYFQEDQLGRIRGLSSNDDWILVEDKNECYIEVKQIEDEKYKALEIMKLRENPSINAKQIGRIEKEEIVEIIEIKEVYEDINRKWGKIKNKGWVCLQEGDDIYFINEN